MSELLSWTRICPLVLQEGRCCIALLECMIEGAHRDSLLWRKERAAPALVRSAFLNAVEWMDIGRGGRANNVRKSSNIFGWAKPIRITSIQRAFVTRGRRQAQCPVDYQLELQHERFQQIMRLLVLSRQEYDILPCSWTGRPMAQRCLFPTPSRKKTPKSSMWKAM